MPIEKHWVAVLFILQGAAMAVDEFHFHRARGLGSWERRGHPLDTLAFALALSVITFLPRSEESVRLFILLSVISCLMITKDEWVHRLECSGTEQWLHSVLFVLHPVVLIAAGIAWGGIVPFFAATLAFLAYQTLYWNFYEPHTRSQDRQSALRATGSPLVFRAK